MSRAQSSHSVAERDFMTRGACRGLDVGRFYTDDPALEEQAKAVCRGCGVREECLGYALHHVEEQGVWGATNEDERDALRARRK